MAFGRSSTVLPGRPLRSSPTSWERLSSESPWRSSSSSPCSDGGIACSRRAADSVLGGGALPGEETRVEARVARPADPGERELLLGDPPAAVGGRAIPQQRAQLLEAGLVRGVRGVAHENAHA